MAWLSGYNKRLVFTARDTTGGTLDIELTMPGHIDDFWNTIDSNGFGFRITRSDGVTEPVFERTAWTYATKDLTISVDNIAVPSSDVPVTLYVYYDPDTVTDGSSSFTPSSPITAEIAGGIPTAAPLLARPADQGQTSPNYRLAKTSDEQVWIWWDVTDILDKPATRTSYGFPRFEEVRTFTWVVQQSKSNVASMFDVAQTLIVETPEGRILIGGEVKAGSDANDYTLVVTVNTCLPGDFGTTYRTLQYRALIGVEDVDET